MNENLSPLVTTLPRLVVIGFVKTRWNVSDFSSDILWLRDQGQYDFLGGSLLPKVATVPSLMVIRLVEYMVYGYTSSIF